MVLTKTETTFADLKAKAKQRDNIRVGATKDIERRRSEYQREGYSGTMFYFKTKNMKTAENELLKCTCEGLCPMNVQQNSNASEEEGYVYVIIG